jgi:hypothetical protein
MVCRVARCAVSFVRRVDYGKAGEAMTRRSTESDIRALLDECRNAAHRGDLSAAFLTADVIRERAVRATAQGHRRGRRLCMMALAASSIVDRTQVRVVEIERTIDIVELSPVKGATT